jgi:hypothetical protein
LLSSPRSKTIMLSNGWEGGCPRRMCVRTTSSSVELADARRVKSDPTNAPNAAKIARRREEFSFFCKVISVL